MTCLTRGCRRRGIVAGRCRSHARKRADHNFSNWIRARDGMCMAAGFRPSLKCSGELQTMHLISRRYHAVRWNPDNAAAGCQAHHLYLTHRPLEHEEFCRALRGDGGYEQLREMAMGGEKALIDSWMETFAA